jgi:hypothetical protein
MVSYSVSKWAIAFVRLGSLLRFGPLNPCRSCATRVPLPPYGPLFLRCAVASLRQQDHPRRARTAAPFTRTRRHFVHPLTQHGSLTGFAAPNPQHYHRRHGAGGSSGVTHALRPKQRCLTARLCSSRFMHRCGHRYPSGRPAPPFCRYRAPGAFNRLGLKHGVYRCRPASSMPTRQIARSCPTPLAHTVRSLGSPDTEKSNMACPPDSIPSTTHTGRGLIQSQEALRQHHQFISRHRLQHRLRGGRQVQPPAVQVAQSHLVALPDNLRGLRRVRRNGRGALPRCTALAVVMRVQRLGLRCTALRPGRVGGALGESSLSPLRRVLLSGISLTISYTGVL